MLAETQSRALPALAALACCLVIAAAWTAVPHPVIGPVVGALVLAGIVALRNPFLLALAFIVFSFFRVHEAFPVLNPLRLPLLLALGTLTAVGLHLVTGRLTMWWTRELSLLFAFLGLCTVGMFFARNFGVAFGYWNGVYIKIVLMVPTIAWLVDRESRFQTASLVLVLSGMLIAGVALYNSANGIGLVEGTRVTIARSMGSPIGDPNDLSLVLLFPVSFAFAMVMVKGVPWYARLVGLVGLGMILGGILATQSRGGLLGFAAVAAIFANRRIKSKIVVAGLGAVALMLLFAVAGISERASGGAHTEGIDASAMGRLVAWQTAWAMALDRPLNGVGINNFYTSYFFYTPHWDGKNHAVHSTWMGVLGETGFPGFFLFVALFLASLLAAWQVAKELDRRAAAGRASVFPQVVAWGSLAGLVGFAVSGTFLTMGFTWPLYIQLALALAVTRFARDANREHPAACPR